MEIDKKDTEGTAQVYRKTRRRVKRSYRRAVLLGIVLLVLCFSITGIYAMTHSKLKRGAAVGDDNIIRIMLLGVDQRKDDVGRSDTLMVAAVDTTSEKTALLSIPRDTCTEIDGNGYDKINHAYAFGGHELSQKSVEHLLGVPMDHYIIIDIQAFKRIIDMIGGVDIDVEKRMHYEDPWDDDGGLVIDLSPGEQHMDGEKAIQYVRYRDGEGDIGRIGRQQKFMKAVLAKVISPEILPRLPKLIDEMKCAVVTDMTVSELMDFVQILKSVHDNGFAAHMVPGQPAFHKDISYWIPDISDTRELLYSELGLSMKEEDQERAEKDEKEYLAALPKDLQITQKKEGEAAVLPKKTEDKPMKPNEISVMVINSSGINGAGASVAEALQKKGFIISGVETGETDSREQTTITTSSRNTDVFYGMPFPCIIRDGGSSNQAVVNIGRDYKR